MDSLGARNEELRLHYKRVKEINNVLIHFRKLKCSQSTQTIEQRIEQKRLEKALAFAIRQINILENLIKIQSRISELVQNATKTAVSEAATLIASPNANLFCDDVLSDSGN